MSLSSCKEFESTIPRKEFNEGRVKDGAQTQSFSLLAPAYHVPILNHPFEDPYGDSEVFDQ